jgi:hypothetical protein
MSKQHKWHKEIKAWADGAEIEQWYGDRWEKVNYNHDWNEKYEYRIKPQPKEPQYLYLYKDAIEEAKDVCKYLDAGMIDEAKAHTKFYWMAIGKIKLEVED